MKGYKQRIMGIRLGKPPVYFKNIHVATEKTGITGKTIYSYIKDGIETKSGWSFDYAID